MSNIGGSWDSPTTHILDNLRALKKRFEEQRGYIRPRAELFMTADQAIAAFQNGVLSPYDQTIIIFFPGVEDCRKVQEFIAGLTVECHGEEA